MEHEFAEFSEFSESDKSLKHELRSVERSCLLHVCCWHCGSIVIYDTRGGWQVRSLLL